MKERKIFKKLAICLAAAAMMLLMTVPVAAKTYTNGQIWTMSAGQKYHIMNNNISGSKISNWYLQIEPQTSGTIFDAVVACESSENAITFHEEMVKSYSKTMYSLGNKSTYVKTSAGSNKGMLACIRVVKGKVKVTVAYDSTRNSKSLLTRVKQSGTHRPFKEVTVKKGRKISMTQKGSNVPAISFIIGGNKGSVSRRSLVSSGSIASTYEQYSFNTNSIAYRVYMNSKLQKAYSKTVKYDSKFGKLKYCMMRSKDRNSSWMKTMSGTAKYLFPTDYVKISYTIR